MLGPLLPANERKPGLGTISGHRPAQSGRCCVTFDADDSEEEHSESSINFLVPF
jgi:hypothetical protein